MLTVVSEARSSFERSRISSLDTKSHGDGEDEEREELHSDFCLKDVSKGWYRCDFCSLCLLLGLLLLLR
jgi:hypothetical protein